MKLSTIQPNSHNPRLIKDEKFKKLCTSIKEFPKMMELRPIIVDDDNTILGGNMRFRALQELGYQEISDKWIKKASELTESEKKRFIIEDNVSFGEWDWDILANEWDTSDLEEWGLDLSAGFNQTEIVEDEVPEVSEEEAKSKLGEMYQLGRHRVRCGDATKIEDVELLMGGAMADLVVTDPPYNTGMTEKNNTFSYNWTKNKKGKTGRLPHMFNDKIEDWEQFLSSTFANFYTCTKGECAFYVFIDWRRVADIKKELEKRMDVKNVIVWDKQVHGLGGDYKYTYELCVVAKKGKPEINNRIGTDYQDIWRVQKRMGRNKDHATAKPIELLVKPILHASKQDDIILDLFLGSGTTLIACEQTNRICYGMEIYPKYVDVIRRRYAKLIGKGEEWEHITPKI